MKYSTIAVGIAALFATSAIATPIADNKVDVRQVNNDDVPTLMARQGLGSPCSECIKPVGSTTGWVICHSLSGFYKYKC
jgi:hypothetical protein